MRAAAAARLRIYGVQTNKLTSRSGLMVIYWITQKKKKHPFTNIITRSCRQGTASAVCDAKLCYRFHEVTAIISFQFYIGLLVTESCKILVQNHFLQRWRWMVNTASPVEKEKKNDAIMHSKKVIWTMNKMASQLLPSVFE